jgi:hypothetical protein
MTLTNSYVEDRVYDVEKIVEDLDTHPHTYQTIMRDKACGTFNCILRRKLNVICKQGRIFKLAVPGTRFGQSIFYKADKKYRIMVKNERYGVSIYYFFKFKKLNSLYINVEECFKLNDTEWKPMQDLTFFNGDILLFI